MDQVPLSPAARAALPEFEELWRERHADRSAEASERFLEKQQAICDRHGLSADEMGTVFAVSMYNVAREVDGEEAARQLMRDIASSARRRLRHGLPPLRPRRGGR